MTSAEADGRTTAPAGAGRRILFIQHAGALGGSAYSLLFTMEGLRECGFRPEVALLHPSREMRDFYGDAGFRTHPAPAISILAHTTGGYARPNSVSSWKLFVRQLSRWPASERATMELVRSVNPDIVHLNSVVLLPSARALNRARIPHVWHVRECPPKPGWRTRMIGRELVRHPAVVFISQNDRQQWVGGKHGVVVPNFVDTDVYDKGPERDQARRMLNLPGDVPVVLYLGGTTGIKGFTVMIQAMSLVKDQLPGILCVMPGAELRPSQSATARAARAILPMLGWGTAGQRLQRRIERLGIQDTIRMLPFAKDVLPWLAACNALVFPSVAPHFARPVIEAAAMGRPAIGSDIGGVRELIEPNETGMLVPPNDPTALAGAILKLMTDPVLQGTIGARGRIRAHRLYNRHTNVRALISIYHRVLGDQA